MLFKASAPGSLMLLGEYAVLQGKHALVSAVNKRMTVTLKPRQDQIITIHSALGQHQTTVSQLKIVSPFQFVLTTIMQYKKMLTVGCDITIESEFSDKVGFASSAAVTVATLSALSAWLDLSMSQIELAQKARHIVRKVQGLGSGADVAACVFGGIVGYKSKPFWIQKEIHSCPITVIYSGNKTPTVEAVKRVQHYFFNHTQLYKQICHAINQCALDGFAAVQHQNWVELGNIMNIQQGLMCALGVNTPLLGGLIDELRSQPSILGAKISGSGLGDCVIGLGLVDENVVSNYPVAERIMVEMTNQGVMCEKI